MFAAVLPVRKMSKRSQSELLILKGALDILYIEENRDMRYIVVRDTGRGMTCLSVAVKLEVFQAV